MTWLVPRLRHRGSIRKPKQTANASGGFDQTYEIVTPLWMELKPIDSNRVIGAMYKGGTQISELPTHVITVRRNASLGVDFVGAAVPSVRGDYFIFVDGDNGKGRLFRVYSSINVRERGEYLQLIAKEIEEQGAVEFVS